MHHTDLSLVQLRPGGPVEPVDKVRLWESRLRSSLFSTHKMVFSTQKMELFHVGLSSTVTVTVFFMYIVCVLLVRVSVAVRLEHVEQTGTCGSLVA